MMPSRADFAALERRFFACEGCSLGPAPTCASPLHTSFSFGVRGAPNATQGAFDPVSRGLGDRLLHGFHSFVCELPLHELDPELVDREACFARDSQSVFCDFTVGKTLRRWAHLVLGHSMGLAGAHFRAVAKPTPEPALAGKPKHTPTRFEFAAREDLEHWRWLPRCPAGERAFASSSCDRFDALGVTSPSPPLTSEAKAEAGAEAGAARALASQRFSHWARQLRRRDHVGAAVLLQGVALRLVLERHLGPCMARHVGPALASAVTFVPRGPQAGWCGASGASDFRGTPVVAMHIRRGDACDVEADRWRAEGLDATSPKRPGRDCFTDEAYMRAAVAFKRSHGACQVRVATDDADFAGRAQALADEHGLAISLLPRRADLRPARKRPGGGFVFIEDDRWSADQVTGITASAVADLLFLSARGSLVVGTGSATMSRLLLMLVTAHTARVPPFVSLDTPFDCFRAQGRCAFEAWS